MEEEEERRGLSPALWTAWAIVAALTYVGSAIPIVMLSGLGYLDWIYDSPIEYVFNLYCYPLRMLAESFPPYQNILDFIHGLVV